MRDDAPSSSAGVAAIETKKERRELRRLLWAVRWWPIGVFGLLLGWGAVKALFGL